MECDNGLSRIPAISVIFICHMQRAACNAQTHVRTHKRRTKWRQIRPEKEIKAMKTGPQYGMTNMHIPAHEHKHVYMSLYVVLSDGFI